MIYNNGIYKYTDSSDNETIYTVVLLDEKIKSIDGLEIEGYFVIYTKDYIEFFAREKNDFLNKMILIDYNNENKRSFFINDLVVSGSSRDKYNIKNGKSIKDKVLAILA